MVPKVSIGMPVFNGQDYILNAIDALRAQTFRDFELIISDNCSTDRTEEICKLAAESDSRIRYVRQDRNIGAIQNFNVLIELAVGEYFKWAAHDDLMEPMFVERCVEALDRDPLIAWCHTRSDMIDARGKSFLEILPETDVSILTDANGAKRWKGHPRDHFDSPDPVRRFRGVILGTNWCADSYGLFRLDALKKTRRLLCFYGAEKVLLGEISMLGTYYEVPELLFYQRVHDKASSNLQSAGSQAEFVGAKVSANPFVSSRLAILRAHLGTVLRGRLSLLQKMRGMGVILCYVLQVKKWHRILSKVINGQGIGGGGRRMLKSFEKDGAEVAGQLEDSAQ